ncbi:glycosyltransferase family 2 protein [bacterium]|nr:glycosyltransferase family 2 protein [bacterium]
MAADQAMTGTSSDARDLFEATYALVIAHNSGEALVRCAERLAAIFPGRVIVFDNASADDAPSCLPDGIRRFRSPINVGYCAAVNELADRALNAGARAIVVVNPDAAIDEASARNLVAPLAGAGVAAVYGKVVRADDPSVLEGAWGEATFRHRAVRLRGEGARDGPRWNTPRRVLSGHGAAFAARVDAFLAAGGLAPELFAYQDEAEFGLRLAKAGYASVYEPRAVIRHDRPSDAAYRARKAYFVARNSVFIVTRHGGFAQRAKFALFLLAGALLYYLPRAIFADAEARASLGGWMDGLRGRFGPRHDGSPI